MTFRKAVEAMPRLKGAYRDGLKALRPRDRTHIDAEDPRNLSGSVDIDTAYKKVDPQGNRWDFGIAYRHTDRKADVVYWVETHTASDSQVRVVVKKAQWLLRWFKAEGKDLAAFEKSISWISSGATTFILSAPQRKLMAQTGLQHVGGKLRIRNERNS